MCNTHTCVCVCLCLYVCTYVYGYRQLTISNPNNRYSYNKIQQITRFGTRVIFDHFSSILPYKLNEKAITFQLDRININQDDDGGLARILAI